LMSCILHGLLGGGKTLGGGEVGGEDGRAADRLANLERWGNLSTYIIVVVI